MASLQYVLYISLTVWIITILSLVNGDVDTSVCDPQNYAKLAAQNPPEHPVPQLPDHFTVRVECNILDQNITIDIKEFYDGPNDRGAVHMWQNGTNIHLLFSYKTDELLAIVDQDDGIAQCAVQKLSTSPFQYLFGLTKYTNGTDRVSSPQMAFKFGGNIPEVYNGTDVVRGIIVSKWESCIYWAKDDATMRTTYYFSSSVNWTNSLVEVEPVRAHVFGRSKNATVTRDWEHIYDFADFTDNIVGDESETYEVPHQTYCPGRIVTKEIPTISDAFTFSSEILDLNAQTINIIKEYYDFNSHLFRYDYYPDVAEGTPTYGTNLLTRIHDFNTGVAYIVDTVNGNCSVTPIDATGLDAAVAPGGNARIRTKEEFFDLAGVNYEYTGVKKIRGIDCDVYTAQRNDWPVPGDNIISNWEWSFATQDWLESVGYQFEFNLPIQFRVTSYDTDIDTVYNLYSYKEDRPYIWKFDISPCFSFDNRKDIQFALNGQFRQIVEPNELLFKDFVVVSIAGFSSVSPLRVANLQFSYINDDIIVSFSLLDVAPITGDVQHIKELTLEEADALFEKTVNSGDFIVKMDVDTFNDLATLRATPYTYKSTDVYLNADKNVYITASDGYSSGSMAGLGIAMIIISFGIGFGILFFVFKMKGRTMPNPFAVGFSPKRFGDNTEIKAEEGK
ncbi:uncharacterized protein LOC126815310 [Patella vulgata]|uniref:uncharacterized protein LOC126815310 n=1 Tax=Patella vulgata TaxID=6465 RepID=UPI0021805BCE|nr:uncharacterized protein LOC126815310 [Patella vulgata]